MILSDCTRPRPGGHIWGKYSIQNPIIPETEKPKKPKTEKIEAFRLTGTTANKPPIGGAKKYSVATFNISADRYCTYDASNQCNHSRDRYEC